MLMRNVELWLEPQHEKIISKESCTIGDVIKDIYGNQNYPCGGKGKCGKCKVKTRYASIPEKVEEEHLSAEDIAHGWRLACVSKVKDGMHFWAPDYLEKDMKILEDPNLSTNKNNFSNDNISLLNGYRLACDIGTTTVVVYLLHPEKNEVLYSASALNQQICHGGDVISRIFSVCENYENLKKLQNEICSTLNTLIVQIFNETGITKEQICEFRIAGNTTMEHLLLGRDPRGLGKSPFQPDFLKADPVLAKSLNLALCSETPIILVPNLSSFIGGDITAGIYYTGMAGKEDMTLLLDIGTNNEMILGNKDVLCGCSAAAGPALEGAQIHTGMRAASGAVEKVWKDGSCLQLQTIGNTYPKGICGSGLIDLLALLLQEKVIMPSGKFANPNTLEESDFSRRLRKSGKRNYEFVYCFAQEHDAAEDLILTQKDIREVQLAKSAINVGIDKLLAKMNADVTDLACVYLAGAFGNYIDQKNARILGILPPVSDDAIQLIHNSAGMGVCKSGYDPTYEEEIKNITLLFRSMNLAEEEDFHERFLKKLEFSTF